MKSEMSVDIGTEIVVLVDRSGSMSTIKYAMEKGFDEFLGKFRGIPNTFVSLFEFNDYFTPKYIGVPAGSAERLHLEPYGNTALYDAIIQTANHMDKIKNNRAMLLIITDGQENASKAIAYDARKTIKRLQDRGVEITYLGSNQDAILAAKDIGITSSKAIDWTQVKAQETWGLMGATAAAYTANATPVNYSDADRKLVK